MTQPTDQQLVDLYPWTLHRRMQLQGGQDLGPCRCEFCMNLRRERWEAAHGIAETACYD